MDVAGVMVEVDIEDEVAVAFPVEEMVLEGILLFNLIIQSHMPMKRETHMKINKNWQVVRVIVVAWKTIGPARAVLQGI